MTALIQLTNAQLAPHFIREGIAAPNGPLIVVCAVLCWPLTVSGAARVSWHGPASPSWEAVAEARLAEVQDLKTQLTLQGRAAADMETSLLAEVEKVCAAAVCNPFMFNVYGFRHS
jgi:hypothetical protein